MEKDNGVQVGVDKVVEQAAQEALAPVEAQKQEVRQPSEEVKRVPLAELQKERQRRRIAEEELTRFRQELDEVKATQQRYTQSKDEDDLIDEAEKSLGIDREQARKFVNLTKKAAERVIPKQDARQQMSDPALVAMDRFKQRAAEAARDYDDWDQMIPSMQAIMARELQENGLGAYAKSPEYYYSKAVRAQKVSEAKVKEEVAVDRDNSTNLSQTESGSAKRSQGSKINQAVFDANRSNPKWIRENRDAINELISQGKLK